MFSDTVNILRSFGVSESLINLVHPEIPVKKDDLKKHEIYHPFKLPISYVSKEDVFPISSIVDSDLELNKTIYKTLFKPKNEFSVNLMKEWSKQITTNIKFLEESQEVIKDMNHFTDNVDTETLIQIWSDTKENKDFLEKYYYMDWNQLLYLNKSSFFLQILYVANVLSPLISLLIPIIFLIFPFLILKIQGIPITFEMYINVLKETAKHHFIGKTLINIQKLSWDKLIYVILTFGLYVVQIYQNINICNRFYNNLKIVNKNLINIRSYLYKMVMKMKLFVELHDRKETYKDFYNDIEIHSRVLEKLYKELSGVSRFKHNFKQSSNCGYLLKCYYDLQNDSEYDLSLRYFIGFEEYIGNMKGVYENIK